MWQTVGNTSLTTRRVKADWRLSKLSKKSISTSEACGVCSALLLSAAAAAALAAFLPLGLFLLLDLPEAAATYSSCARIKSAATVTVSVGSLKICSAV